MRSRETGPARPASQSGPMNPILRGSLDACLTTLVAAVSIAASTLIVAFPWVPLLLHSLLLGRYALYMWGGVGVVLLLLAMWRFFRLRSPEPQLERMKIRDCRFEAENPEGARDYMLDKYGVDGGPGDDWVPGCVSRVLPRQPMSVQKGLRLPLIRHNRRKERLEFRPGVCVIPHDSKAATGGEDAHFWSKQMDVIGVADGVSSISQYGIDPKQFSTQLMARCRRIAEERWDAKSHAERERERERGRGSAKGTHQNENNTRKDKGEGSEVLSSCCATSAAGNAMTSPEKEEGDGTVCVAAATGKPEEEEGGERKAKEETGDSGETSLDGEGEGTQMEKGKEKVKEHERENNLAGSPGSKGSEKDKETGSEKDPQLMVAQRALQILYSGYRSIRSAGINGASTAAVAVLDSERNFLGVVNLGDSGLLLLRRGPHGVFRVVVRTVDLQHRFNCPYQLSNILGQEGDSVESSDVLVCHVQEGDLVVVGTDGLFDNVADAEIAQVVSRAVSPIEAVRLRVLASATLRGMNAEAAEAGVKAAASVVAVSGWPPSTPKAGPGGNAAGSGPLPLPQAHPDGKAGEGHLKEDENGGVEEKEKAGTSQVDVSPSSFRTVEEEGSTKNQSPSNSPKAGGNSADSPDGSGEEGGRGQESGCPSGEVLKEGGELTESQRSLAQAPYYSSEHDLASKSLESASSSSSGPMLEDQEGQQRASENDENEKGGGTLGVSRAGKEKEKNVSADLQKEDKDRREKFERRLSDAQKEIGGEIPRNLEATHPKKIAQALAEFAYERSHSCRAMTPFTERCLKEGIRWEGGKPDDITVLCSWIVRRAEGDPALLEAREGGGEPADIPVPQQNAVGIHRNEPAPWRGLTAQGGGARVGSGGGGGSPKSKGRGSLGDGGDPAALERRKKLLSRANSVLTPAVKGAQPSSSSSSSTSASASVSSQSQRGSAASSVGGSVVHAFASALSSMAPSGGHQGKEPGQPAGVPGGGRRESGASEKEKSETNNYTQSNATGTRRKTERNHSGGGGGGGRDREHREKEKGSGGGRGSAHHPKPSSSSHEKEKESSNPNGERERSHRKSVGSPTAAATASPKHTGKDRERTQRGQKGGERERGGGGEASPCSLGEEQGE